MARSRVENDLAPLCQELGLGLTTFSPLNYGILSGKYNNGIPENSRAGLKDMNWLRDRITPQAIDKVKSLTAIANDLGATTAQLAIAWLLRRKEVSSIITGATRVEQLDENLAAAEIAEKLDDHVLEAIEELFPQDHH
jgi:aryl-alcohol dehydrogenase-like predicted oxidoreductase